MISSSQFFNVYVLVFSLFAIVIGVAMLLHPELSLNRWGGFTPAIEIRIIGLVCVAGGTFGIISTRRFLKRR